MLRPLPRPVAVGLPLFVGASLLGALLLVFFYAPREAQMGEVWRIFYMHATSAFLTLACFGICAIASLVYLIIRRNRELRFVSDGADRLAHAAGEIGVLFGVIVLITGPIWAKPAWGTWWTWEPRLTLLLLTVFLFVGYVVLRAFARRDPRSKLIAAGVGVAGGPAAYLIHIAVTLWGGNHPQVVTGDKGGGLEGTAMNVTFFVSLGAVLLLGAYLVFLRMRHHKLLDEIETSFLELSDLEDQKT